MASTVSTATTEDALELITTATPYLALYTSNPTLADTGTEVTGGSYVRQAITFGAIVGGVVSNTNTILFPDMPLTTVTHWAIKDAITSGNQKMFGSFSPTIPFLAGDDLELVAGQLTLTLTAS